jgi:hypothetical protein
VSNLIPQWSKGQSGNPSGMPKWVKQVRRLAAEKTPRAIEVLAELMEHDEDSRVRMAAAIAILAHAGCAPPREVQPEQWVKSPAIAIADAPAARLIELVQKPPPTRNPGNGGESA